MVADFKNNKQKQENQVIVEKFIDNPALTFENKITIYLSIASVALIVLYYIVTYIISFINSFKK